MPLRRVAGALPRGQGRQVGPAQDEIEAHLVFLEETGLDDQPDYWAIFQIVPTRGVLPPSAVKGAPTSDAVVRPGTPKTLRRWQNNARMRRVATAWRPDLSPEEAVAAWYAHGGTMQPLRWSDAETDALAESLEAERRQRGEANLGQFVLFVGAGRSRSRRRRTSAQERGEPGSERRARYNARRREAYARRRR